MRLPKPITKYLMKRVVRIMDEHPPDYVIGEPETPYMLRWWVISKNQIFNIYLHMILRSDDDRALHDHPFSNISILLQGNYIEHTIAQGGVHYKVLRKEGDIVARFATKAHRLEILPDAPTATISLFITGPRTREWYFHCVEKGKVWWQDFVMPGKTGQIGKGCGD